jgi:hypothetical protein
MVREFAKPQAARAIEARARARCGGVRVAVIVEARRYCTPARSEPGTTYTIARTPVGWACSCPGYFYTGVCKHLGAVARRAEREGWAFGTVAPLATVARYMPLDPPCPDPDPEPEPTPPAGGAALAVTAIDAARARGRAALAELFDEAA